MFASDTFITAWVWQPIVAPLHILGGAVVLAALAVFAYVRVFATRRASSTILLVMRLAAIVVVSLLLMGPSQEKPPQDGSDAPRLAVLVDTSQSMRTEDCATDARIAHVAKQILEPRRMARLQERFRVDVRAFDERVHPLSMEQLYGEPVELASGDGTHLGESVASVVGELRGERDGDVMLVVSDGRDSEDASVQPAAAVAKAKGVPVFTIGVGGSVSQAEAALLAVPMQESLLPGEAGAILVKIFQSGLNGKSTTLRVKQGEQSEEYPVDFGDKPVVELQIPVQRDEPGQYRFELSMDRVGEEQELTNNAQTVFCEVLKRRIRVLVLEGQPFWDTKFLADSLRKDERIELTQITQLAETKRETIVSRTEDGSPRIPETAEDWSNFEVVILGRGIEKVLTRASADLLVERIVDGGGQLIFARGRAYEPSSDEGEAIAEAFAVLEPVEWNELELQQVSLELTPSGRGSAWLAPLKMGVNVEDAFTRLPGFDIMKAISREKPGTLVLARAVTPGGGENGSQPAITQMTYGRGAVVSILGEGLWRWSLLKPDNQDLRGFYDTFWSNLIRWLALGGDFPPGQQIALQLSRTTSRLGDELTADVACKLALPDGATPRVELVAPDGTSSDTGLHRLPGAAPRYRAELSPATVGVHKVRVHAPGMTPELLEQEFNVYDVNLERLHTAANPLALEMLAQHTGGAFFQDDRLDELERLLERQLAAMQLPPQMEYVWDQAWILVALLGWMGLEWIARRVAGLW